MVENQEALKDLALSIRVVTNSQGMGLGLGIQKDKLYGLDIIDFHNFVEDGLQSYAKYSHSG